MNRSALERWTRAHSIAAACLFLALLVGWVVIRPTPSRATRPLGEVGKVASGDSMTSSAPASGQENGRDARAVTVLAKEDAAPESPSPHPDAHLALATKTKDDLPRLDESSRSSGPISQNNPDEALEHLARLPAGPEREQVVSSLSQSLGAATVEQITGYLDRLADSQTRNEVLKGVIQVKIDQGAPKEAAALLPKIPAGDARSDSARTLAGTWAREDPPSAAAWLDQLPMGLERDLAVGAFSSTIVDSDPEGALQWAGSINDTSYRSNSLQNLSRQWLNNDRPAATSWIQSSILLTEDQRSSLLLLPSLQSEPSQ
jgi:hypothetical protein